ncbi:unnamed protein product [Effrenium voratum]|nr:unnamed protein product [Effrenium voratum]
MTCGCCAKDGGSIVEDRQDSRPFFCRKSCGLDEETDFLFCDPAGVCFEDTLAAVDQKDRLSFRFAGSSNLAALRWRFVWGASPKVADSNGTTLLHVAARAGSFQIVKDLVLRSIDVNSVDCAGWTPLHVASCMGRQDVSLYLLQMGAKSTRTSRGHTAESLCSHPHTKEVVVGFEERRPRVTQVGLPMRTAQNFEISSSEMGASLHFEPFFVPREPALHEPRHREDALHWPRVDFFGSMGKEREKDGKLKPDPEKVKVSEKEYNPFLRGEESNLPVPESASASSIPKDLCVGAAWAGKNDWRKRAQRRQAADNERDEPRKQAASPSRAKREVPKDDVLRGPTGGGWRAKKAKLSDGVLLPDQWLQPPHDEGEKGNAFTLPPPDPEQNVKVLEEVDAAGRSKKLLGTVQSTSVHTKGRNKRGNANAVPAGKDKKGSQGYYEDDNVSLTELLRRERVEGVQDYDSNFGKHILKRGDKFKMLDEDEDEAYALGWYENKDKKMDERKGAEKRLQQEKNDKNRVQVNLERCAFCMDSKKFFRKGAIMSVSPHAYLCVEAQNRCVVPGQVVIVPQEHAMAMTDVDEARMW